MRDTGRLPWPPERAVWLVDPARWGAEVVLVFEVVRYLLELGVRDAVVALPDAPVVVPDLDPPGEADLPPCAPGRLLCPGAAEPGGDPRWCPTAESTDWLTWAAMPIAAATFWARAEDDPSPGWPC